MLSLDSKFYIISGFCWVQTINKPFQHNQRKQQQKRSIREQNQRGRKKKTEREKSTRWVFEIKYPDKKKCWSWRLFKKNMVLLLWERNGLRTLSLSLSLKWQVFVCVSVRGKKKSSRWEARRKSRELYGSISLKLEKFSFFEFQTVGDFGILAWFLKDLF
jgi:hypothetical protein